MHISRIPVVQGQEPIKELRLVADSEHDQAFLAGLLTHLTTAPKADLDEVKKIPAPPIRATVVDKAPKSDKKDAPSPAPAAANA